MFKTLTCAILAFTVASASAQGNTEERKAALLAKTVSPQSFSEAISYYGSQSGYGIAISPKITPDNALYYIDGHIELTPEPNVAIARNKRATSIDPYTARMLRELQTLSGQTQEPYFGIAIPKELMKAYQGNARMNSQFNVIGAYVGNTEIIMTTKAKKQIPVLRVVAIEFGDGVVHYAIKPKEPAQLNTKPITIQPQAMTVTTSQQPAKVESKDVLAGYTVSFKCSAPNLNDAELNVCTTRTLSQLDGLLASTYRSRTSQTFQTDPQTMRTQQLAWVDKRNQCGKDEACMEAVYRQRIQELCEIPVPNGIKPMHDCESL